MGGKEKVQRRRAGVTEEDARIWEDGGTVPNPKDREGLSIDSRMCMQGSKNCGFYYNH